MKVYQGVKEFSRLKNAVVTTGTFDGVHVGHQKILQRLKTYTSRYSGESVLLTFWPHPRLVLNPDYDLKLLTTFDEKVDLLQNAGIQHLIKISFTRNFSKMSADEYIRDILVDRIGTRKLIVGYDHRFGKNREGDFRKLVRECSQFGFEVEEIPKQELDDIAISSTRIREALANGNIHIGTEYLGRLYSLRGSVVRGQRVGRTIGFPTANIEIDSKHKLVPCDGSYAVKVRIDTQYHDGMLNIGFRPTVDGSKRSIEVHLFGFERDIYGQKLEIQFVRLIRKEEKFENVEALKKQLLKDKETAMTILEKSMDT